jgi:flagellar protein FlbT
MAGDLYLALKEARKLVAYERKLLDQIEAMQANADVGTAA